MKRTLLMSLAVLVYFTSCKKDSGGSSTATGVSQISLSIDGAAASMDTNYLGAYWEMDTVAQTQTSVTVTKTLHIDAGTTKQDYIEFGIAPAKPTGSVVAGTYSETSAANFYTYCVYGPADSSTNHSQYFLGYFGGVIAPFFEGIIAAQQVNPSTANATTVVITSIDNNWVKGTLKGDAYYTAVSSDFMSLQFTYSNKHSYSNGNFVARMYN